MIESVENTLNRIQEIRKKINSYYSLAEGAGTSFKEILAAKTQNPEPRTLNLEPRTQNPEVTTHHSPTTDHLSQLIEKYSQKYSLDPALVRAVIKVESNFNSRAISPAGAKGLMQLMPQTAKDLGVENIFDPEENIAGGTRYLREMLNQFDNDLSLSLAAYNAGPTRVRKSGGIPNIQETQNYVKKVLELYKGI